MALTKTQKDFVDAILPIVTEDCKKKNLNIALTLAQACLESGYGASGLSKSPNYNLFGMKGSYRGASVTMKTAEQDKSGHVYYINAPFRKYPSWKESIQDHNNLFTDAPRYKNLIGEKDYKIACANVQKDGYATDVNYTNKLIATIEANGWTNLDKEEFDMSQDEAKFVLAVLSDYFKRMEGQKSIQEYTHFVANRLRDAVGLPKE